MVIHFLTVVPIAFAIISLTTNKFDQQDKEETEYLESQAEYHYEVRHGK